MIAAHLHTCLHFSFAPVDVAVIHCVDSVANEAAWSGHCLRGSGHCLHSQGIVCTVRALSAWSGHCPRRDVVTSEVFAVVVVLLCR